ncbi:hypothetical protein [Pseudomonas aeruginosa]|uniref:hypothetical protein n=1 Tax=Pseudomonas aeruginosa TaxID=287 RepID=UPI001968E1F8|nr:hypothetical protein [Pseudomonas aeruginosa]HCE7043640.1 hypothetical protein [Pseudomonas aeruginosa]HCE7539295.1 hypothetical protein [Pseudomonas aeruginosa]HCE9725916.1 hypothetical protein [Pseudomonas aeruginosa]HCE9807269.1 hypothetical protein [Pseudomonas aeruginosa]HCF1168873.1 hypothetical protein [Pseudomonas aeruginosa]
MMDREEHPRDVCVPLRADCPAHAPAMSPRFLRLPPWWIGMICALLSLARPASAADALSPPVALVQALYETYAWEAVVSRPRSRALFQQPASVLRRYFDEPLTRLILANQDCERRTREVCRLDMAPLWNSSDPAASDLQVEVGSAPGEVRVRFHRPGEAAWSELTFVLTAMRGAWRIRDIRYGDGITLVRMLTPASAPRAPAQGNTR